MWIREHCIEIIGLVIAALTYFGVQPSSLSVDFSALVPAGYILAGALIGWGLCRARHGLARLSLKRNEADDKTTFENFSRDFARVPFELKTMIKGALLHGSIYMRSEGNYGYVGQLGYLYQFLDQSTIRNHITRLTPNEACKALFRDHPDLLMDVKEGDLARFAVKAVEGEVPYGRFTNNGIDWWFLI